MPNKTRVWTEEELKQYNLVDTAQRPLPLKDKVLVRCRICEQINEVKFAYIKVALAYRGKAWACKDCLLKENSQRGKVLCGEKNPFFGKKHSKETRDQMKASSRVRWDNTSIENKQAIGEAIRAKAIDKYGCNPMLIPDIKQKYHKTMKEKWQDDDWRLSKNEKSKQTCQKKYGADSYISSEEWSQLKTDHKYFTSKAESEILDWLLLQGIEGKKRRKDHVEIDIFIGSKNIGIEFNGAYWHSEKFLPNHYHYEKYLYCQKHDIQLIQIFDWEWKNKKEQVLNRLEGLLGVTSNRVGARECEIKMVETNDASVFFENNHIQGFAHKTIKTIGLFKDNILLCAASFGKHHRNNKTTVLTRFCTKSGYQVVGSLSRLSKHASEYFKEDIITWCDLRWSNGNGYISSGWEKDGEIAPDYYYIKHGNTVISKQSRRKSVVHTPDGMTEHEHALRDGLLRVYDCGKIRFIYRFKNKQIPNTNDQEPPQGL